MGHETIRGASQVAGVVQPARKAHVGAPVVATHPASSTATPPVTSPSDSTAGLQAAKGRATAQVALGDAPAGPAPEVSRAEARALLSQYPQLQQSPYAGRIADTDGKPGISATELAAALNDGRLHPDELSALAESAVDDEMAALRVQLPRPRPTAGAVPGDAHPGRARATVVQARPDHHTAKRNWAAVGLLRGGLAGAVHGSLMGPFSLLVSYDAKRRK